MTWTLTRWAKTRRPLAGVPWRDLTDEEFASAEVRYPSLRAQGYFEQAPLPAENVRRRLHVRVTEPQPAIVDDHQAPEEGPSDDN